VRAAAHIHSEWSDDASWPLSRIAATFARWRYSVVLMSEHSRGFTAAKWQEYIAACEQASTPRLTLVPGIEYNDDEDVVHIPVWGRVPFFGEQPPIGHLLPGMSEAGGTAVWAHPWRRGAAARFDPAWSPHLAGVEVWNRKYDGIAPNQRSLELSRRHDTRQFVALDFHTRRQLFPLALALHLEPGTGADATGGSPARTAEAVYAALHAGQFSARALGLTLERLTDGRPGAALRTLESARAAVARLVH
jgi:hypothetical protein